MKRLKSQAYRIAKTQLRSAKKTVKPEVDYFSETPGSLPGTLSIEADAQPPVIVLIDYSQTNVTRQQLATPEECLPYLDSHSVSWIDVQGLGSENILQRLGQVFKLHPLLLEDVVNVPQRPKVEDYELRLNLLYSYCQDP